MFEVTSGYYSIQYKTFIFNGGEIFVKINTESCLSPARIHIKGNIEKSDDLMELLMLTDALRRAYPDKPINLVLPYFPYARQDRVMETGQSLSVKVVADIINSQNYDKVTIFDAHSDVTPALLNNCENVPQDHFIHYLVNMHDFGDECILVAPDSGAIKKVFKAANRLNMSMVRADKNRDVRTGEILETIVYTDHVGDKDFLIVDDICDGGKTFIELAKVLRTKTTGLIYLYVTHGIFANGLDVFDGIIDRVYCRNVFSSVKDHPLLQRWER